MKYFKVILFIILLIAIIRTVPDTLSDMHNTPTVIGGLMVLALFGAILYFLIRSIMKDFNKIED